MRPGGSGFFRPVPGTAGTGLSVFGCHAPGARTTHAQLT